MRRAPLHVVLALVAGCSSGCSSSEKREPAPAPADRPETREVTTTSGLKYVDDVVGQGKKAELGKTVVVHYTGTLDDGTKFDSSRDRDKPFEFPLGEGKVIKGWDEGVAGMRVGGKRRLVIPPELGYGSRNVGPIPANSTLHFEVELLDVK